MASFADNGPVTRYGEHPRLKRSTEPIDWTVWHWFVCHGPHGARFQWHRDSASHTRNIDLLREFILEREASAPGFSEKARLTAIEALGSEDAVLVATGIQVLAVVGTDDDMRLIQDAVHHRNKDVRKHARCALYERGVKPTTARAPRT